MIQFKRYVYNILVTILVLAGLAFILGRFVHFGHVEYTDNAQVRQHITPVISRVQGYVKEIRFDEYKPVRKGDTLLIIEDAEYRLLLAQAEADLANASSGSSATGSGISETQNRMLAAAAACREAAARLEDAEKEDARYQLLLTQDAVTRQQYDHVHTAYLAAQARYQQASQEQASLAQAKAQQGHRLSQSGAAIRVAEAALELARLNLSYTVITSPCDGMLSSREITAGQLVQPGQKIVDVVDMSDIWIIANYRETQLENIAVGSTVSVKVDALPNLNLTGRVESLSDATGAILKKVPQDNATGNFVKVVQRIPVRISLHENNPEQLRQLRAGMNVECEISY